MNAESPHARQIILAGPEVDKIETDVDSFGKYEWRQDYYYH
jgi:hypothetical protein